MFSMATRKKQKMIREKAPTGFQFEQITPKVDPSLVVRAKALIVPFGLAHRIPATRNDVLREALARGIASLEAELLSSSGGSQS